jgi:predicted CoA-substrate-specific enzyme activase
VSHSHSRIRFEIGLDVGSTTVKAVAKAVGEDRILWQDYRRHETKQAETALQFLTRIEEDLGAEPGRARVHVTGSGSSGLVRYIGGRYVQEVNAVSLAVERMYPDVHSVIELGGQDAKILMFLEQEGTRSRKRMASMNDKCAGGTGAVLDKIGAKLNIPAERLCRQRYRGHAIHRVAGKCGVFAESDINGLQKQGVPADELMASLFEAIVLQNLSVLTRGNVPHPKVLLLGGPNTFIAGMQEAWQAHIPRLWQERNIALPAGLKAEELIFCPENGQYFAALGAIEFGREQDEATGVYRGRDELARFLEGGHGQGRLLSGGPALRNSGCDLDEFLRTYSPRRFQAPSFGAGVTVRAYLGVDGGSTSTKTVLLAEDGKVLAKAYQLSQGNPIQDTIQLLGQLREQVEKDGARLEILAAATTGYAKDVLRKILSADVAVVETVAHANSALALRPDVDVIVDVGGQDIKLIVLRDGHVKDFMLNTQCSAGNGYFLQAIAKSFGVGVEDYAARAFAAESSPEFSYGCAVFLQADVVNFQRQGWQPGEVLAGLAAVLPKNIWLYVAKIANLPSLGSKFLLQGGTQRNLAAVKAQVDYIRARFQESEHRPEIAVHEHCGEAGAIGAALEATRWRHSNGGRQSSFIGLDAVQGITYSSETSEATRCHFCTNNCLRTFVDFHAAGQDSRIIAASCEKGQVEDAQAVRAIIHQIEETRKNNPNLVDIAARSAFKAQRPESVADRVPSRAWTREQRKRKELMLARGEVVIGIPRVFNQFLYAPFFSAYLESLDVPAGNVVWSDFTSDELYRAGAKRGSVDPCFPSKVVISHIHNLLHKHARKRPIDFVFLPMFDVLESFLEHTLGSNACPTVIATPLAATAAFTDMNVRFLRPQMNFVDRKLLAHQMLECWAPVLGVSPEENERAIEQGFAARRRWQSDIQTQAKDVLSMLERENRLGIVMLGRPYHHDPGLNHGIFEEFQKLGYPVFSQNTLPLDEETLTKVFGGDHPLDIDDVWKHSYSASTSHKIWAAKFVARHPNLIPVEVSNFKCGHDAPAYQLLENIVECAGRPYFCFKDLDENKPAGAIRIRIETIDHYLKQWTQRMQRTQAAAC